MKKKLFLAPFFSMVLLFCVVMELMTAIVYVYQAFARMSLPPMPLPFCSFVCLVPLNCTFAVGSLKVRYFNGISTLLERRNGVDVMWK